MNDSAKNLFPSVYPWQLEHWQKIGMLIETQRLPHAVLLSGPRHIGKWQFAEVLAQRLLCAEPAAGYACGRCKQCYLLQGQSHPDLLYLEPEEERKAIKIDAVRELGEFFGKTAQQGGWKIAIISPAENMNINAANALLKNLEEPSGRALLLLVSHDSARLLPTIRSRCRILNFGIPTQTQVLPWLQRILPDRNDHEQLLRQAAGKPLWALKLLGAGLLDDKIALEETLQNVAAQKATPLEAAAACMKMDDLIAIDWLQNFVLNAIREDNSDRKISLFSFLDQLQAAKKLFLSPSNPNRQLVWEALMLDWQRASANKT